MKSGPTNIPRLGIVNLSLNKLRKKNIMKVRKGGKKCTLPDCDVSLHCKGYCQRHYNSYIKYNDPYAMPYKYESMKFIEDNVSTKSDKCIDWPFLKTKEGYGKLKISGVAKIASRVMCELAHGSPPTNRHVAAHKPIVCHNPSCINPNHIRWATEKEKSADKFLDGTVEYGEASRTAKLTESQVLAIREDKRTNRVIAKDYGVGKTIIGDIKLRKKWKHLS